MARSADGEFTGRVRINNTVRCKKDNAIPDIAAAKLEIVKILLAEEENKRKAAEERNARIEAIPGLKEIRAAREDLKRWHDEFEDSFRDVGGMGVRPKPQYDFEELYRKYPRASAYLKAEAYSRAANYAKASAGKKALERIINGEECDTVLSEMEAEWSAYVNDHVWD